MPVEDAVLDILRHTFKICKADESHIITCYENALKKQESDTALEELFFCYVRSDQPKNMQLIAQRLFKFTGRRCFLFWSVCSMIQQPSLPPAMLAVAEKMIYRAIFDATISNNDVLHQVFYSVERLSSFILTLNDLWF